MGGQGTKRKRDFEKKFPSASKEGIVFKNLQSPKKQDREADQKSSANSSQHKNTRSSQMPPKDSRNTIKPQPSNQPPPLTEKRKKLLHLRSQLPIASHAQDIRLSLHGLRDVLLLVGETGSGKSTQVPQFLMGEPWCTGQVAITQPRRVAAISLAKRVADEMGTTLGNAGPASKVGYSVRFDNNVSSSTKIKFLTEGMLLQELLRDRWLSEYSVVVVDEVHERGVNVDLVLGFLRKILVEQGRNERKARKGKGRLKVVVMSATADTEKLFHFFEEGFVEMQERLLVDGEAKKVNGDTSSTAAALKQEDKPAATNGSSMDKGSTCKDKEDSKTSTPNRRSSESSFQGFSDSEPQEDDEAKEEIPDPLDAEAIERHHRELQMVSKQNTAEVASSYISTCHVEGRQYPVQIYYAPTPTTDFVEAALKTIFQIHYKEPLPGDILVFLTGQDTIEYLEKLINEHASAMPPELPKILALPLFAALPQNLQANIFTPTPKHTRKIILATNIAETSLTIPGIVHVIDAGLAKIKEHRPGTGLSLSSLLVKPISKSSALQRKGRAGRERAGKCWRLYPESEYLRLDEATRPEILRADVADAVLVLKARGVLDPITFPLLDRPPVEEIRRAMLGLYRLGALDESGKITADGRRMAKLPLPPAMARVLVSAGTAGTATGERGDSILLLAVVDIISALSVDDTIFLPLSDESAMETAASARRELLRREGDHLTYLGVVRGFAAENADRKNWCERRFVSYRAMRNVMDVRKQLRAQCVQQGLMRASTAAESDGDGEVAPLSAEQGEEVLKTFLTGFSSNVARLMPDGSYKSIEGNATVAIHPSSVMFGRKVEGIVYQELVFTSKAYARGVSAVELGWWADAAGALKGVE